MKNLMKFSLVAIFLLIASCDHELIVDPISESNFESENLKTNHRGVSKSTVTIFNPIYGTEPGTSTLHRNANGLTVNYKTTGLIPGNAYTLWWVIWNYPNNCGIPFECTDTDFGNAAAVKVEVMYATGHVVGNSGKGNFSARLNAGDDAGSINHIFGLPSAGGLNIGKAFAAEVHLVLRNHGPAVPGIVNEQIGGYLGGCVIDLGVFTEDADEIGECSDIEFAIHPPEEL